MNTEQAFVEGFVKRASEYGIDENQAVHILKEAAGPLPAGRMPARPPVRGLKRSIPLGRNGQINEVGLHVPADSGGYLSRMAKGTSNPGVSNIMEHLQEQNHIDDIVDGLSGSRHPWSRPGAPR
jgi:hypothetical protein